MITLQKFYLTKTMITDFRCLLYASSYRWTMSSIPQILLFFYLFPVFYFTIQFEINAHFEDFVVLKSLFNFTMKYDHEIFAFYTLNFHSLMISFDFTLSDPFSHGCGGEIFFIISFCSFILFKSSKLRIFS